MKNRFAAVAWAVLLSAQPGAVWADGCERARASLAADAHRRNLRIIQARETTPDTIESVRRSCPKGSTLVVPYAEMNRAAVAALCDLGKTVMNTGDSVVCVVR